jgi:hypothetical protein
MSVAFDADSMWRGRPARDFSPTQAYSKISMKMNSLKTHALCLILFALTPFALSQTTAPDDSKTIPVIDGAIGTCSVDFTITDTAGTPVYAAKIKVHIAYGFMYARKLDLEVGTNSDGKARFIGLPDRVKRGLFFEASEGNRTGNAFDDPSTTCKTQFTVVLRQKP